MDSGFSISVQGTILKVLLKSDLLINVQNLEKDRKQENIIMKSKGGGGGLVCLN